MSARAVCDCGWESERTTPRHAKTAAALHRCEAHARRTARAERVAAAQAARTAATCDTCGWQGSGDHTRHVATHGTLRGYCGHFCRCEACRTAKSRAGKATRLDAHRGRPRLVDTQPARDHVQRLTEQGMTLRGIALTAGWATQFTLTQALGRKRIRPETLARILAVTPDADTRDTVLVDGLGSRRRLRALAVIGWSAKDIAAWLGWSDRTQLQRIQCGRTRTVQRRTATAITRAFDSLWDTPGPSRRAASHATRRGWLPPMAWDDPDDPDETPDPTRVLRVDRPSRRRRIDPDEVFDLLELGHTVGLIADRYGTEPTYIRELIRNRETA